MNPKTVAKYAGAYLAVGALVAAHSAWKYSNGENHFRGITADTSPMLAILESIVLWPYAAAVNFNLLTEG